MTDNTILNFLFSSFAVTPSRSPSQGNLTGSARKVKDAVADLHNNIQKWEAHNSKGAALISKISNAKMEAVYVSEVQVMTLRSQF